jgi:DNA-directed RNA polymerase specialized sigma24 family protein
MYDQEEFLEAFKIVSTSIKKKYKVDIHDGEDISQQMYFVALKVMQKYKPESGPILNFLSVSLRNRSLNFLRDKKSRFSMEPDAPDIEQHINKVGNTKTSEDEFWEIIDEHLPAKYRADYIKMKQGVKVNKSRKNTIIKEIKEIVRRFF